MRTRRFLTALAASFGAVTLALAPAAAASAHSTGQAPPAVSAWADPTSATGTSDFTFDSFDAVYNLGLTSDKRSSLAVKETLVAEFPAFDQNHGILRVIPVVYDSHPLRVDVKSVTDANGRSINFETSVDSENMTVKIGDGDTYVHGRQTYVITYTEENVTRYFADTNDDEFYWDTNGLMWAQPFGKVTATVKLVDGLASKLTSTDCYFGADGSKDPCADIKKNGDGSVVATQTGVGAYQNVTIALGFPKGTFHAANFSLFDYLPLSGIVGILAIAAAAVTSLVLRFTQLRDARGTGIIIAQYEPPAGIDPLLAANIMKVPKRGMAAAIVDLAVKKKLKIVERPNTGFWGGESFGVQQIDDSGLDEPGQSVMTALFSPFGGAFFSLTSPGLISLGRSAAPEPVATADVRWLQKNDQILGRQVVSMTKAAALRAQTTGLRRKGGTRAAVIIGLLTAVSGLAFLLSANGQTDSAVAIGVIGINAVIWIGIGLIGIVAGRKPLTAEGSKVKEHLIGLKEYIRLAEADRLQMLQSVTGADRIDTNDGAQIIKVYEKLLPYAVLFNLEKEWAGTLGKYYDQNPPDWYDGGGINTFSAVAFASSIGSMSSSVASSYSGSSSSSSSGGSGGGGSSGGGGGGGGGGGW